MERRASVGCWDGWGGRRQNRQTMYVHVSHQPYHSQEEDKADIQLGSSTSKQHRRPSVGDIMGQQPTTAAF